LSVNVKCDSTDCSFNVEGLCASVDQIEVDEDQTCVTYNEEEE